MEDVTGGLGPDDAIDPADSGWPDGGDLAEGVSLPEPVDLGSDLPDALEAPEPAAESAEAAAPTAWDDLLAVLDAPADVVSWGDAVPFEHVVGGGGMAWSVALNEAGIDTVVEYSDVDSVAAAVTDGQAVYVQDRVALRPVTLLDPAHDVAVVGAHRVGVAGLEDSWSLTDYQLLVAETEHGRIAILRIDAIDVAELAVSGDDHGNAGLQAGSISTDRGGNHD